MSSKSVDYWTMPNVFPDDVCDEIIEKFDKHEKEKACVYGDDNEKVLNESYRDVSLVNLSPYEHPATTIIGFGFNVNNDAWKFNVTEALQADYLTYEKDGLYKSHVDSHNIPGLALQRKITLIAFLNDDFEGGKFYQQITSEKFYPPQQKGSVLAFPSYILHGVEPVTSGVRKSIVAWLSGPSFK